MTCSRLLLGGWLCALAACSAGELPLTIVLGNVGQSVTLQTTLVPPDGVALRWELVAKPAASAGVSPTSTTATATFTVDAQGVYLFDILVDNGLTTNLEEELEIDASGPPP